MLLFNGRNFVKGAKFHRNYLEEKKRRHPDLTKVLVKKFRARSVVLRRRKGRRKLLFSFSKELISRKTQNKGKFRFF